MIHQYYFLLCLSASQSVCLEFQFIVASVLGSFSYGGEVWFKDYGHAYKQCMNKRRGLAYYLGLRAMLTRLLGLSGLELSRICLLCRREGDSRQISVSVHADGLWARQHPRHPFGSWSTRLKDSSLPKLENTPWWSTNSRGYDTRLPFGDLILKLCFWFDRCMSCSLFLGHAWHWAKHSWLSILQNCTEDGLNSISALLRRLQIWCPLSGLHPNIPVGRSKTEVAVTALILPYPVSMVSRSKTRLW